MSKVPGDLIQKDPSSIEPYIFDWTAYLAELGEDVQILASQFEVTALNGESPAALVIDSDSIIGDGLKARFVMSGGTLGQVYVVTNRIEISGGVPTDDRSVKVKVVQR